MGKVTTFILFIGFFILSILFLPDRTGQTQAFFTNSDFNPIWPMPSILQSMS